MIGLKSSNLLSEIFRRKRRGENAVTSDWFQQAIVHLQLNIEMRHRDIHVTETVLIVVDFLLVLRSSLLGDD